MQSHRKKKETKAAKRHDITFSKGKKKTLIYDMVSAFCDHCTVVTVVNNNKANTVLFNSVMYTFCHHIQELIVIVFLYN